MQQLQNLFRKASFFTARQMDLKKKLCCQSVVKKFRAKETGLFYNISCIQVISLLYSGDNL